MNRCVSPLKAPFELPVYPPIRSPDTVLPGLVAPRPPVVPSPLPLLLYRGPDGSGVATGTVLPSQTAFT